jgi:hypothetical protein
MTFATSCLETFGEPVAVFDFDHTRFWFIYALLIFPFLCFIPPDMDELWFVILLELWISFFPLETVVAFVYAGKCTISNVGACTWLLLKWMSASAIRARVP